MCSRACLPHHFCSRTQEQCRSPTGNILCLVFLGSTLSPRADMRVAPARPGLRPKVQRERVPSAPHTWLAGKHSFSCLSVWEDCVPPERLWQGHTTPDLVTPLLSFQHTRFKHEPGLLLGKHRAEKSRSRGKIILNSRAHLKPIHIISPTILSLIYEENKTNIRHIYFSQISQPQTPLSLQSSSERDCSRNPPPWIPT